MRTRCETLESGDLSTFDQIFWFDFSKSRKFIFLKIPKSAQNVFFRFLLYNLMVCWHDIKHKLHVIVALHVTKVIKIITGVMQPTYNPILVRILNKIWFCAKPLIHVGNSPLTSIPHQILGSEIWGQTSFRVISSSKPGSDVLRAGVLSMNAESRIRSEYVLAGLVYV